MPRTTFHPDCAPCLSHCWSHAPPAGCTTSHHAPSQSLHLQQQNGFNTSALHSHITQFIRRESVSPSVFCRKKRKLPFPRRLLWISPHILGFSVGYWIFPEPATVTREEVGFLTRLNQSAPLPLTPAAGLVLSCPNNSGPQRLGNDGKKRKMDIPHKSRQLSLWLNLNSSHFTKWINFLWDFLFNYIEVHWVLPQLVY